VISVPPQPAGIPRAISGNRLGSQRPIQLFFWEKTAHQKPEVYGMGFPLLCAAAILGDASRLAALLCLVCASAVTLVHLQNKFRARRGSPISALCYLGAASSCLIVVLDQAPMEIGIPTAGLYLGLGVSAGALLRPRKLQWVVPALGTAYWAGLWAMPKPPGLDPMWILLSGGILFAGSTMMGRSLLYGAITGARIREQARVDAALLRMTQDAELFRITGGDTDFLESQIQTSHETNASGESVGVKDSNDPKGAVSRQIAMRETHRLISAVDSVKDGFYRLLNLGSLHLKPASGFIYFLDNKKGELRLKEQFVEGEESAHPTLPAQDGPVGFCLQGQRPMRLWAPESPLLAHRTGAIESQLLVPISDKDESIGLLIFDRECGTPFSEEDERFAYGLAQELVQLSRTERVLDSIDQDRRNKTRIFQTARALSGLMHGKDVVQCTLDAMMQQAQLDLVAFVEWSVDKKKLCLWEARSPTETVRVQTWNQKDLAFDMETWVGQALLENTILPHVALKNTSQQRHLLLEADLEDQGLRDLRVIPTTSRGQPVGALIVGTTDERPFSRSLIEHLSVIADLAGVTFDSARAFDALTHQANTDGLTGLYNRRTLDRMMQNALARGTRMKKDLCVVLIDVDHFKKVNDTYGHQVGDQVLIGVAQTLQTCARAGDVVARYGGEEFCVLLENTDSGGAGQLAERMRREIKNSVFDTVLGPLQVTASFGVSALGEQVQDSDALLKKADEALYAAKEAGRDRVILATQEASCSPESES
jgi:diguanylate cyclase (GGDEF)-like protein